jgi:hypothetical protein
MKDRVLKRNAKRFRFIYVAGSCGLFVSIAHILWPQGLVFAVIFVVVCLNFRRYVNKSVFWLLLAWPIVGGGLAWLIDPKTTVGGIFGIGVMLAMAAISYRTLSRDTSGSEMSP